MKMHVPWPAALIVLLATGCETPQASSFRTQNRPLETNYAAASRAAAKQASEPSRDTAMSGPITPTSGMGNGANAAAPALAETLRTAQNAEADGQLAQAKVLYAEVLRQQPLNATANHRMAIIADQEQRYSDAEKYYLVARKQSPQNADLLSDIGYSYFLQGKLDESERVLRQALQLQPRHRMASSNLGEVLARRAQLTGSPEDYQRAYQQLVAASDEQQAQARLQQLFPQGMPAAPANQAQASTGILVNPFAKTKTADGSAAGNLNAQNAADFGAPQPSRATQELWEKMQAAKASQPAKPASAASGNMHAMQPSAGAVAGKPPAIAPERIRDEFARIDAAYSGSGHHVEAAGQAARDGGAIPTNGFAAAPAGNGSGMTTTTAMMPAGGSQNWPAAAPAMTNMPQSAMQQTWPVPAAEATWPNAPQPVAQAAPQAAPVPGGAYDQFSQVQQTAGVTPPAWPANNASAVPNWPEGQTGAAPANGVAAADARRAAAQMGLQAGPGQMFPSTEAAALPPGNMGLPGGNGLNSGYPSYGALPGYDAGMPGAGVQQSLYQSPSGAPASPYGWPTPGAPGALPSPPSGALPPTSGMLPPTGGAMLPPPGYPAAGQMPPSQWPSSLPAGMPPGGSPLSSSTMTGSALSPVPSPAAGMGAGMMTWPNSSPALMTPSQPGAPGSAMSPTPPIGQYPAAAQPSAPVSTMPNQSWPR